MSWRPKCGYGPCTTKIRSTGSNDLRVIWRPLSAEYVQVFTSLVLVAVFFRDTLPVSPTPCLLDAYTYSVLNHGVKTCAIRLCWRWYGAYRELGCPVPLQLRNTKRDSAILRKEQKTVHDLQNSQVNVMQERINFYRLTSGIRCDPTQ